MRRYRMVAAIMTFLAVVVVLKAGYIMTVQKTYWQTVAAKVRLDSVLVNPLRGNILAAGNQRLACNLPEYRVYMDFQAIRDSKCDTLWHDSLGRPTKDLLALCEGLHRVFPSRSAKAFLDSLEAAYAYIDSKGRRKRCYPIWKRRIDYMTYKQLKELPIFCLGPYRSGFSGVELMVRNRPYGSLASSIVGAAYKESGKAYSGLELAYDTILAGTPGIKHRRKVLNKFINISDTAAVDGADLVSTIDVFVQDLAERSLKKELIKDKAYTGVAIVMEVETGDIKAMVNLDKDSLGRYYEGRNHAIADLLEPGSVFKTASILTAIDDGYIKDTANCIVHTGCGIMEMYGAKMRDHNWHRGGYGDINVSRILQVSSNIGVSWLIDKFYGDNPGKFVDGIHRLGLATDLKLPFPEYEAPRVRHPRKDKTGRHWANWSKTALPWMSIGYETQVPPISTLTFYNAIANGGKMVRPRFVSRIEKDGEVIKEFPVQVIKNQICKNPASIGVIQDILYKVVHVGLGKTAGSKSFHVSGKTGTAQKAHNGSYKSGTVDYLLSFCGYFPSGKDADGNPVKPKYSCIVCIQKSGLPASGGLMSGQVFHDIAEGIMARNVRYDVSSSRDSLSCFVPEVKSGNILAADYVLSHLGLKTTTEWSGSYATGNPIWGTAEKETKEVKLSKVPMTPEGIMPDVMGMGARDAVYLLESRGLKVIIKGRGKVHQQSIAYGKPYRRGTRVTLEME
ncbi:MAG: penicillin-binding transpeptidase domain-containing protein [Prevotella sp.]|nr:penicillin-binding transpeptidase domain-containing protein [Prevotella sp.]MDY2805506.1 penicillin-binding transpeptidase domain-containing protein [Prevotella sp.]MDY4991653.1 penicillin-binding transpeptidase domain-containing protein [Prevotella sp.]MDY5680842.1 penicillin-binding transpeptidase domain-containing protein [Prevotella sp.]